MLMVRKIVLSIVAVLALSFTALAQNHTVSGIVVDSAGAPIVGATIFVDGTTAGTITGMDGSYSLQVPANATLNVSFMGYETQLVAVGSQTKINVTLQESALALESVTVVGYGSGNKVGTAIGSVAKVKGDVLKDRPTVNVADALQGQVAGMQVFTSSGEPSQASSIRIHGVGSLTAGNTPLILLDGAPITTGTMVMLNPNDIESVNVLKDASATSVYGSRAANGVIFITSKKGVRDQAATITLNAQYGISQPASDRYELMTSQELLDYQFKHNGITQSQYEYYTAMGTDTNWRKELFDYSAPTYQVDLSVSGGSKRTSYYISGLFSDQKGTDPASGVHKYTVRANVESHANDWFKIGMNTAIGYDRQRLAYSTQGALNYMGNNVAFAAILFPTYLSPYEYDTEKGEYTDKLVDYIPGINVANPLRLNEYNFYYTNTLQLNGTGYIQLTPLKNLNIKSVLSADLWNSTTSSTRQPSSPFYDGTGNVSRSFGRDYTITYTNTIDYQWTAGERHNFYVLAGHESVMYHYEGLSASRGGQTSDKMLTIGTGTGTPSASDSMSEYAFNSAFARAEYNFDRKYYVDASVRYDESSRFGVNNRGAVFYAVGAMWDIKRENFMDSAYWLNNLRLKVSYGTQGNAAVDEYMAYGLVGSTTYEDQSGLVINTLSNPDLSWETQSLFTVGINAGFFRDRLTLELEYYNRTTKDMLMDIPYPATSGYASGYKNVGKLANKGFDITLRGDVVRSKDWLVSLYANASYNKNEVKALFNGYNQLPMPDYMLCYEIGHDSGEFYMQTLLGVDPEDGRYMWAAIDEQTGERTSTKDFSKAAYEFQGKSRWAPWSGGFGLSATWKGLSVAADFSWTLDKWLVNNDRYFMEADQNIGYARHRDLLDRWEKPGDVAKYARWGQDVEFDSHMLEDASFLRLKNLTVGYELPRKWMAKTGFMKGVRIYFTARNLLTFTKYSGFDPEIDSNLTYGRYPNSRQIVGGLQLTF